MREFLLDLWHEEWSEKLGTIYFFVIGVISITGLVIGVGAILGWI